LPCPVPARADRRVTAQLKTYSGKKKSDDLKDMPIGGDRPSNWNYSSDRSIFQ
jgi:hypothetical protein